MARKNKISSADLTDLVFENRNRDYGAYRLRKAYFRHVIIGLAISIGSLLLAILIPRLLDLFEGGYDYSMGQTVVTVQPIPLPPVPINPDIYSAPPPKASANVPPKVTKDSVPEPKKKDSAIVKAQPAPPDTTAASDSGKSGNGTDKNADDGMVYMRVDIRPEFPGGDAAMHEFIRTNVVYPPEAIQQNRQGRVYVAFVVNKDGSLTDFKVTRSISPVLDAEAIRVLKKMPSWQPGFREKEPVRVQVIVPVTFSLKKS